MISGEMPMVLGGMWKFGRAIICCIFCTAKRPSYLPINYLYHGGTDSWWRGRDGNELVPLPLLLWILFFPPWYKKYKHEVTLCNSQRLSKSSLKSSRIWYNRFWGISWLHSHKRLCIVVSRNRGRKHAAQFGQTLCQPKDDPHECEFWFWDHLLKEAAEIINL